MDRVYQDVALITPGKNVPTIWTHFQTLHLVMDGLDLRLVRLIDEINHPDRVVFLDEEDVGCRPWSDLHIQADRVQLNPLDDLVQLEVANEQVVALADVANVTRQVIVKEDALCFVLCAHLIVDEVTLGEGVVVVEGIHPLSLSEAIVDVLLRVKAVHKDEDGRF